MLPDKMLIRTDQLGNELVLFFNGELLREAEMQQRMGNPIKFISGPVIDVSHQIVEDEQTR